MGRQRGGGGDDTNKEEAHGEEETPMTSKLRGVRARQPGDTGSARSAGEQQMVKRLEIPAPFRRIPKYKEVFRCHSDERNVWPDRALLSAFTAEPAIRERCSNL